jgi:hypothetical protein
VGPFVEARLPIRCEAGVPDAVSARARFMAPLDGRFRVGRYHDDKGRGVGASHQTGWSGLVALLPQPRLMKLSHVAPDPASPSMVEGSVLSEMPSPADVLRQ